MLAGATQRSDSDPYDKTSPPITVGPHWMIMWPFDPKTTGLPITHRDTGAYIMWAGSPYAHVHIMGRPERRSAMPPAAAVTQRPPLPPLTRETAIQKVRLAEDAWNSRDPEKVSLAYTLDSRWRNRSEFVTGRSEIIAFLRQKWSRELEYRLIKELWAFEGDRIAVRFAYESRDASGNWFRSYGN